MSNQQNDRLDLEDTLAPLRQVLPNEVVNRLKRRLESYLSTEKQRWINSDEVFKVFTQLYNQDISPSRAVSVIEAYIQEGE